jgi:hypothetical protein
MRVLVLAFVLALAGCGSDDTTTSSSVDLSQPVLDLSMPGIVCGAQVCGGSCAGCIDFGGGVCVMPCKMAAPSCASGTCMPLTPSDGGAGASVTLSGNCAGYDGYCG